MEVDVHTALLVGEGHLQERSDETAGRDVVTGHNPTALDEFLDGIEGIAEIFGVLHGGHVVANLTEALGKGRTSETLLVEREVYVIERGVLVVNDDGRNDLLHVAHLATGTDDDRSRRDNLIATGILLRHRERVFTRGHVDVDVATEVRESLNGAVETCVLTLL